MVSGHTYKTGDGIYCYEYGSYHSGDSEHIITDNEPKQTYNRKTRYIPKAEVAGKVNRSKSKRKRKKK